MRQAVAQAIHYARHRSAFGRRLHAQPLMANVLADLASESEAATVAALRLARAYDPRDARTATPRDAAGSIEAAAGDTGAGDTGAGDIAAGDTAAGDQAFRRLATAVLKYWICKRAVPVAAEALECLGGNGYVEEWGMARLLREAPLNSIWEGSGNVQCLDVLRAIGRAPESLAALLAEIALARGGDRRLDAWMDRLRRDLAPLGRAAEEMDRVEPLARRLVGGRAPAL